METVAYRDGVALQMLDTPDVARTCVVCGVPGVRWEVLIPGVHLRGYPEAYCDLHEAKARAEFEDISGSGRR